MRYCSESMSITIGDISESSGRNSEGTPCRLCLKKNDYYYNIFTSIVASQITVEDALYDLVDLKVAVGDGLPATLCALCLEKLIELNDFRNICHKSDAELRKCSCRNYSRNIGGQGAVHDNLRSSTETKDCVRDAIVGTSEEACSVQPNEIFIPVQHIQLPTANMLCHVKVENEESQREESNEMLHGKAPDGIESDAIDPLAMDDMFHIKEENIDPLGEENTKVLHGTAPDGFESDAIDPLANHGLSGRGIYTSSSVKMDKSGDDEEEYDCTDWASNDLMPHASADQTSMASGGKEVDDEGRGVVLTGLDWKLIEAKKEPSPEEGDAAKPNTLSASQGEKVEAQGRGAMVADLDLMLVGTKEEPSPKENAQPTFSVDEDPFESSTTAQESAFGVPAAEEMPEQTTSTSYLLAERNLRNHSIDECIGPTAVVTQIDSKVGTSHEEIEKNLIDEDLEKCGASKTYEISSCSIPDDRQCNTKDIESLKSSRGGAAMAVVGEKSGCDVPNTSHNLRFIRISRNDRSGCETIMGGNNEVLNCLIENPGHSYSSNEDSYNCFNCRDVFSNKKELMKNMKIHFVARNFDAAAESSIVDVSLEALPSSGHNSSCEPTTSKGLEELDRKMLEPMQKENVLNKETSGEKGGETNTRRLTRSFTVGEKSTTQSLSLKSSSIRNVRNHVGLRKGERPYSCSECTVSFAQKKDLTVHKLTHVGGKTYSCSTCSKPFTHRGHLDIHSRTHTGEKPFICKVCSKSFSRKDILYAHVRKHTGERPYSCNVCEKSFSDKSHLGRHVHTHAGGKTFPCRICEKSFTRKSVLRRHIRTHTGEKPFSCNVCERSFSIKSHLVRHGRTHTGDKPYSCSICGKCFTQSDHLKSHMRQHSGEKPFICNLCSKSFARKSHLNSHNRTHTGEKPFSCDVCEMSFSNKSQLNAHVRRHAGEKPFSCDECEKSFSDKSSLVRHVYTHTGEKPYSCRICKKSFTQKGTLKSHVRTHTGERPFSCNVCEKSFSNKSRLVRHIRTHTGVKPYSCSICRKCFTQKSTLDNHLRTHTGEKPFTCKVCGKSFIQKSHLTSHIRTHTREKPYSCSICCKHFTKRCSLDTHMRLHMGERGIKS